MPFCPNCGTEVRPETNFCPRCGLALRVITPPLPIAPSPNESHVQRYVAIVVALLLLSLLVVAPFLMAGAGLLLGVQQGLSTASTSTTSSITTSTSTGFGLTTAVLAENGNQIAVITASAVVHQDGTSRLGVNVTNVSTTTIYLGRIILNDGSADLVNTAPTAAPYSISPNGTYSFSAALSGNKIMAGRGYLLDVTIFVNLTGDVQIVSLTVDATPG